MRIFIFSFFILNILISDLTEADLNLQQIYRPEGCSHTLASEQQEKLVELTNNMLQHGPLQ